MIQSRSLMPAIGTDGTPTRERTTSDEANEESMTAPFAEFLEKTLV
jgi:hypothetical protein